MSIGVLVCVKRVPDATSEVVLTEDGQHLATGRQEDLRPRVPSERPGRRGCERRSLTARPTRLAVMLLATDQVRCGVCAS